MTSVLLALGSNLGDRAGHLGRAVAALGQRLRLTALSSLWRTAPMYVADQPDFLNMAVAAETDLPPPELLALAKALESELGRRPGIRFGPRVVDIDILFYGDAVVALPELEIPHPRLAERAFVLAPLAEIAPEFRHPILGRTVSDLLAALLPNREDGICVRDSVLSAAALPP